MKGLAFLTTAAVGVSQAEHAADVVAVNTIEDKFVYTDGERLLHVYTAIRRSNFDSFPLFLSS